MNIESQIAVPTVTNTAWTLTPGDPFAHACAKVARVVLRITARMPTTVTDYRHEDLGQLLVPVFLAHSDLTEAALAEKTDEELNNRDVPLTERLNTERGATWIGRQLVKPGLHTPALLAACNASLDTFVMLHCPRPQANATILQAALNLDEGETRFLDFAFALYQSAASNQLLDFVDKPPRIAVALNLIAGKQRTQNLTNGNGRLANSGLFEYLGKAIRNDLDDLLRLSALGERLCGEAFSNARAMAQAVLEPIQPPCATESKLEWRHLEPAPTYIKNLVRSVLEKPETGINLLLHGRPGTGKTAFAKTLVAELGCDGYWIAPQNARGTEASRQDRLAYLQLTQRLAGNQARALIVLDEAEDIFQSDHSNVHTRSNTRGRETKSWVNQLLETNRHPVIWISNQIESLDPAYLRRFNYVLEFKSGPLATRKAVAALHLAPLDVLPETLETVSNHPSVTPAMLASAARFARLARAHGESADAIVLHHVRQQLETQGDSTQADLVAPVLRYDPALLNLRGTIPAANVINALVNHRRGTAVFTGPPGTGKTQLAAHIAGRAGLELLLRTAADINTMWFGESERNVARLFSDCDPREQMIFLDEADTLLAARSTDTFRADRAVTAEFLRRLEAFQGVFVCATNHGAMLDPALARRFMFRLDFAALNEAQRIDLLVRHVWGVDAAKDAQHLWTEQPQAVRLKLARLEHLTPGDFANVARRMALLDLQGSVIDWLEQLAVEHASKQDARTPIGF
jgi:SpoVK/Ycf46/Vps4 family AAA+-type ATPase